MMKNHTVPSNFLNELKSRLALILLLSSSDIGFRPLSSFESKNLLTSSRTLNELKRK